MSYIKDLCDHRSKIVEVIAQNHRAGKFMGTSDLMKAISEIDKLIEIAIKNPKEEKRFIERFKERNK